VPEAVSTLGEKSLAPVGKRGTILRLSNPEYSLCTDSIFEKVSEIFYWKKIILNKKINHTRAVRKEEMGTCLVK
jgi:hypothetical protein